MSRLFPLSLFALFVGLTAAIMPAARAVNCDVSACISMCSKGKVGTSLQSCSSWCQLTIQERKDKGQCKK